MRRYGSRWRRRCSGSAHSKRRRRRPRRREGQQASEDEARAQTQTQTQTPGARTEPGAAAGSAERGGDVCPDHLPCPACGNRLGGVHIGPHWTISDHIGRRRQVVDLPPPVAVVVVMVVVVIERQSPSVRYRAPAAAGLGRRLENVARGVARPARSGVAGPDAGPDAGAGPMGRGNRRGGGASTHQPPLAAAAHPSLSGGSAWAAGECGCVRVCASVCRHPRYRYLLTQGVPALACSAAFNVR